MRICISGATKMNKSKFVKDFIKEFPNYKEVKLNFRDHVNETLGEYVNEPDIMRVIRMGNAKNQDIIRDSIINQISQYTREDNVIYDRGLMDNLVYSLYLSGVNADGCNSDWVKSQLPIMKEAMKMYDIIFFMPLLEGYYVPEIPQGSLELDREVIFRSECDNIFKALQKQYLDGYRLWLPKEDTPALIELFGTPQERIQMSKLYLDESGNPYGDDKSLINDHLKEGLEFLEDYEKMHKETLDK